VSRSSSGRGAAAERAGAYLRELLFDGKIRPGDKIDQDEIAAALGVSRQPVRDAVQELSYDGLLVVRPRKGVFVGRFDAKTVRGHYELNGYLEAYAARKVARQTDASTLEHLREFLRRMQESDDPVAIEAASTELYRTLNVASDNPRIGDTLRVLRRFLPGPVYARYPSLVNIALEGAAALLDAIERGDADAAAKACTTQWNAAGEIVVADLVAREVIES
jgi:DNA-binding GntR family transcriptional regulator